MSLDFDMTILDYVESLQRQRRRPPAEEQARCELLAVELVEGQILIFWDAKINPPDRQKLTKINVSVDDLGFLQYYYFKRWRGNPPSLDRLCDLGFLDEDYSLSPLAFELYEKYLRSKVKIFISYRRAESSMLALYIYEKLSAIGYDSFLDMQSLELGQNWQTALQNNIQNRDYFVLLLSKRTLSSKVVVQEIMWAFEHGLKIIPVWHNGFVYDPNPETKIPPDFENLLTYTHTLIVDPENPAQYKQIVDDLLAYFDKEMESAI